MLDQQGSRYGLKCAWCRGRGGHCVLCICVAFIIIRRLWSAVCRGQVASGMVKGEGIRQRTTGSAYLVNRPGG